MLESNKEEEKKRRSHLGAVELLEEGVSERL